jgi:hypothetical protein
MAPVPKRQHLTTEYIFRAYEAQVEEWESLGISVSECGLECDRALFYSFRWASPHQKKPGRIIRRMDTGSREEPRLIGDLQLSGVDVSERQRKMLFCGGHVRGKADAGKAVGFIEAPKAIHALETKALNAKRFRAAQKHGCAKAEPLHYAQCQLAMHAFSLERCAYFISNTDDDDLHLERIKYDIHYASRLVSRLRRIIEMQKPPGKLCSDIDDHRGMFCKHKNVCFGDRLMCQTCRSCIFAKPELEGDGIWSCERHEVVLSTEEQKAACPQHLNIPDTVPGELVRINKDEGTITYNIHGVGEWIDGPVDID